MVFRFGIVAKGNGWRPEALMAAGFTSKNKAGKELMLKKKKKNLFRDRVLVDVFPLLCLEELPPAGVKCALGVAKRCL